METTVGTAARDCNQILTAITITTQVVVAEPLMEVVTLLVTAVLAAAEAAAEAVILREEPAEARQETRADMVDHLFREVNPAALAGPTLVVAAAVNLVHPEDLQVQAVQVS